jgi:hypothetical protein
MDWCINTYENANHHPVAILNGDESNDILIQEVSPGDRISLDASASKDPDGDALDISWWYYKEAGTCRSQPGISHPSGMKTSIIIPEDSSGTEIHIILEVKDRSEIASLWDYRRMVFRVK